MQKKKLQKLKDEQRKWYARLQRSGFKDIEVYGKDQLKTYDSQYFVKEYSELSFAHKQRYYELARQLLEDHVFRNGRDREVWRLHSEGCTVNEIGRITKLHWSTVGRKVRYYAKFIKN